MVRLPSIILTAHGIIKSHPWTNLASLRYSENSPVTESPFSRVFTADQRPDTTPRQHSWIIWLLTETHTCPSARTQTLRVAAGLTAWTPLSTYLPDIKASLKVRTDDPVQFISWEQRLLRRLDSNLQTGQRDSVWRQDSGAQAEALHRERKDRRFPTHIQFLLIIETPHNLPC